MEHPPKSLVFPTEIIELIIDQLQDDIYALTRISATSHAILHTCRRRLFRSIKLGFQSPTPYVFVRLLRYNPTIGQYVRELALHVHCSLSRWVPGKQSINAENIQTLTQMPFVEKLSIRGNICPPTSWNSLHETLQQPILNCIHSVSLTELSIYNFVISVTIFRSCVNLSALKVNQVEDSGKPEPINQARMSPRLPQPKLQSFEIGMSSSAFAFALVHYRDSDGHPLIRFDGLKTLLVHFHHEMETQVIEDICKEAIELETLTCIGITGPAFLPLATQWPDFSRISTLKTLKGQCNNDQLSEDLLLGLCEKLQMFPPHNVLETLDIEIFMGVTWDRNLVFTRNEWGRLDDVLSCGFPRLHTVSIDVVFSYRPEYADLESAELRKDAEMVRKMFPWLNENAAVKFNFLTSFLF